MVFQMDYFTLSESSLNFANLPCNKSYICIVRVVDMFKLHKLQIYRVKLFPKTGLILILIAIGSEPRPLNRQDNSGSLRLTGSSNLVK